jgi:hypothetical protein
MAGAGNPIRGQERAALVDDLANRVPHEVLVERYGYKHIQSVKDFSARNAAEIAGRRQVLEGALADETKHLWVADKVKVAERYQDAIDDLYADFQTTEDLKLKSRFARDLAPLLHAVGDLYGHFVARSKIDLELSKASLADFDEVVMDEDGVLHAVAGTQHDESRG